MKSKRFLCTVLACVVMISCITNAAAIQEEVADDFVEYNTESILTTRASEYYSRVRCYGEYPNLTYKAGNYCVTCKKVLSTSESDYYTPATPWQDGNWVSFHHTVESRHTDHFVCPFVINTSGLINDQLYAIGGDIWVNYTDTWS